MCHPGHKKATWRSFVAPPRWSGNRKPLVSDALPVLLVFKLLFRKIFVLEECRFFANICVYNFDDFVDKEDLFFFSSVLSLFRGVNQSLCVFTSGQLNLVRVIWALPLLFWVSRVPSPLLVQHCL